MISTLTAAAVGLLLCVPLVVWATAFYRRASFGIRGPELTFRSVWKTKQIAREGDAVTVIRVAQKGEDDLWWQVWSGPLGTTSFDERAWPQAKLQEVADAWKASMTVDPEPATPAGLAKRYPDGSTWLARHPAIAAAVILPVLVIALLYI